MVDSILLQSLEPDLVANSSPKLDVIFVAALEQPICDK
jgi:hypothetical protein